MSHCLAFFEQTESPRMPSTVACHAGSAIGQKRTWTNAIKSRGVGIGSSELLSRALVVP